MRGAAIDDLLDINADGTLTDSLNQAEHHGSRVFFTVSDAVTDPTNALIKQRW